MHVATSFVLPTVLVFVYLSLAAGPASDQQRSAIFLTETRVHLREGPSTTSPSIRLLPTLSKLTLRSSDTLSDASGERFVKVRTTRGDSGFVAAAFIFQNEEPSVSRAGVAPLALARSSDDTTVVRNLSRPLADIDATWVRFPIGRSVMRQRGVPNPRSCGPRGEGSDPGTFLLKNRNDYAAESHAVTFDALRGLPLEKGVDEQGNTVKTDRTKMTQAHLDAIHEFEGIPLTVTGFLAALKPQGGGSEKTNCGFSLEANTDWHLALVENDDDPERTAFVVEPTPRFKRRHAGWITSNLRDLAKNERDPTDSVRITGYLFYDPDHRPHIKQGFRFSMWELHPVTRIEVFVNGRWINLDDR